MRKRARGDVELQEDHVQFELILQNKFTSTFMLDTVQSNVIENFPLC